MKKNLFLMLLFIVLSVAGAKAQVVISNGSGTLTPHPGAFLDLQSVEQTPYAGKGLLLPRVELIDVTPFGLSGDEDEAVGMIIYQDGDTIDKGIYLWTKEAGQPGKWKLVASVE
ncbi:MAG: hypothetical protein LBO74_06655 [Candidatus Symbiothrix sp.]|nr:hypothetical protein [Candidatus Symbiothrix sp.]